MPSPSSDVYSQLEDYQQGGVEAVLKWKTVAAFLEQGVGKTWLTMGVLEALIDLTNGDGSFLLVVPLTNKVTTWQTLIEKLLPQASLCLDLDTFNRTFVNRILLLHYEQLTPQLMKRLQKMRWTLIVFDESQRLKERSSLSSRNARKLRYAAEYKMILTGTPMDERPSDLWAQFRFLRPSLFGENWGDFEKEYMEQFPEEAKLKDFHPKSFKWKLLMRQLMIKKRKRKFNYERLPQFLEIIKPYCLRVTQDVLGLKLPVYRPVKVHLLGEQRQLYDRMWDELVVTVNDRTITAPMKAVKIWRAHQICGGTIKDEEGKSHVVGRAKVRKLKALCWQAPRPVVVFCRYTAEVELIRQELTGLGRIEIFTGKNKKERPRIQQEFQEGKIDFLIAQIKAGGIGIDLFRSHYAILYSFGHSWIDFDQAVKRLQRRGQTHLVTIILLIANRSIDELILEAVLKKCNVVEYVLTQLAKGVVSWRKKRRNTASMNLPKKWASSRRRSA